MRGKAEWRILFSTEMSWMLLTHEFKEGWVMFASQTEKYMLEDWYYRFCDKQRLITMPLHRRCIGNCEGRYEKNICQILPEVGKKWAGRYGCEKLFHMHTGSNWHFIFFLFFFLREREIGETWKRERSSTHLSRVDILKWWLEIYFHVTFVSRFHTLTGQFIRYTCSADC